MPRLNNLFNKFMDNEFYIITKKFDQMTGGELKALRDSNPTEYDRLKNEFYGN
jgi:hypothetical protein